MTTVAVLVVLPALLVAVVACWQAIDPTARFAWRCAWMAVFGVVAAALVARYLAHRAGRWMRRRFRSRWITTREMARLFRKRLYGELDELDRAQKRALWSELARNRTNDQWRKSPPTT